MDVVPIIIFAAVVPLWLILHYVTKWKTSKTISPDDESLLGNLRKNAEKLEDRLAVMERILDDEVPDWRTRRNDPL
ncbi:MAG: envelope stress response membrane protein PspB [Sphingomonadales bacterium]